MSLSALSDSFQYLSYGSTTTINIVIISVRGWTLVYGCQILATNSGPRPVSVKITFRFFFNPCKTIIIEIVKSFT